MTQAVRLVRVSHARCGEYDGTEYLLAPTAWSNDKIADLIRQIRQEMIEDAKQVSQSPLKPSPYGPSYKDHPDKTVAEVQRMHDSQKAAYDLWVKENGNLGRSFQERAKEIGFFSLSDRDSDLDIFPVDINWDHNHGLSLNYQHLEY